MHANFWLPAWTLISLALLLEGCGESHVRPQRFDARQDVVSTALAQLGTPYRYGGASPNQGFDCSGLVRYAHLSAGIEVPRRAIDQYRAARSLGRHQVRAGDLVFFAIPRGKFHVGILVDADRFVHAPSSGKRVEIASLHSPYWSRNFQGAASFLN
jgi:cell wall-associated NlpC family hydrolase